MKKVLFIQPTFNPLGGGEAVAAWMLQAINQKHTVTAISYDEANLKAIDLFYGTSLSGSSIHFICVNKFIKKFVAIKPDPYRYLECAILMFWCKIIKHKFDIIVTAFNETDFGKRGIQYVHFPHYEWLYNRVPKQNDSLIDKVQKFLIYRQLWLIISRFSFKRMKMNVTITNSLWTKNYYKKVYEQESTVIYPPTIIDKDCHLWENKKNQFVTIGRFSQKKDLKQLLQY